MAASLEDVSRVQIRREDGAGFGEGSIFPAVKSFRIQSVGDSVMGRCRQFLSKALQVSTAFLLLVPSALSADSAPSGTSPLIDWDTRRFQLIVFKDGRTELTDRTDESRPR